MRKSLLRIIVASICIVFFASCSSMYIPNMTQTPLLTEKGEIQAEVGLSTNAIQLGADYAITDHLAAMATTNISYGNFTNFYDIYTSKDKDSSALADLTNYGKFKNRYYELGVGYYNIANRDHFKMEAFGGAGFCHATDEDNSRTSGRQEYDSKYALIFGQFNLGFAWDYAAFGLGVRVAPTFHSYEWINIQYKENARYEGTEHFTMWHFEPLMFVRLGSKNVRFVGKMGISLRPEGDSYKDARENHPYSAYMNTTIFHFSVGVNVKIPTIK